MKEISVQELKALKESGSDYLLIDVREQYEYDAANLGGVLIPLGSILDHSNEIPRDKQVVVHCRSGARSATAIRELENRFGFDNLSNLKGGIIAWQNEIGL
ncbi:MAG: rhodanese-like domain-containing protein [Bacteroidota bacterium]|jgi:rhodanese-related sulfurtransferase